jgi:CHASE2 domain-containing sensor protein
MDTAVGASLTAFLIGRVWIPPIPAILGLVLAYAGVRLLPALKRPEPGR